MALDYNSEQNQLTRKCVYSALMLLMESKGFHEISITDITEKAGVSRMAYYRNYGSKEEIITSRLDVLFEGFFAKLERERKFGQYQTACLYFHYCRRHRRAIGSLARSNMAHLLETRFARIIPLIIESDQDGKEMERSTRAYTAEFLAGGLYRLTMAWIAGGMRESDEEMAAFLSRTIA